MAFEAISVAIDGGVAAVDLNRPERKNAMTVRMVNELREGLAAWAADDSVGVIVLGGAGGAFCSGLDLAERNSMSAKEWSEIFGLSRRELHRELYAFDKPVVCALERYAINAGSALALACDFMVVGETAYLQVGEVQQGRPAAMNLAWLRLRFGDAVARRVALRGDRVLGPELERLGIAISCVADSEVRAAAMALSQELAQLPPEGTLNTKRALRELQTVPADGDWFLHAERITAAMPAPAGPMPRVR